jgi:hypothetical protein
MERMPFDGFTDASLTLMLLALWGSGRSAGANWYGQVKAKQVLAKDAVDAINNGVAFAP